jgi:hypothetical protein
VIADGSVDVSAEHDVRGRRVEPLRRTLIARARRRARPCSFARSTRTTSSAKRRCLRHTRRAPPWGDDPCLPDTRVALHRAGRAAAESDDHRCHPVHLADTYARATGALRAGLPKRPRHAHNGTNDGPRVSREAPGTCVARAHTHTHTHTPSLRAHTLCTAQASPPPPDEACRMEASLKTVNFFEGLDDACVHAACLWPAAARGADGQTTPPRQTPPLACLALPVVHSAPGRSRVPSGAAAAPRRPTDLEHRARICRATEATACTLSSTVPSTCSPKVCASRSASPRRAAQDGACVRRARRRGRGACCRAQDRRLPGRDCAYGAAHFGCPTHRGLFSSQWLNLPR